MSVACSTPSANRANTKQMESLQALGEVVRAERERRGLSQEALADLTDMSRTHIGEIERGEVNVSFTSLQATADGLGLALSALIIAYERRIERTDRENPLSAE